MTTVLAEPTTLGCCLRRFISPRIGSHLWFVHLPLTATYNYALSIQLRCPLISPPIFEQHVDLMVAFVWATNTSLLQRRRITILDSLFTSVISNKYMSFKRKPRNDAFVWHPLLLSYISGSVDQRDIRLQWIKDVDTVYMPMNWGKRHWVALVLDLLKGHIHILDPFEDLTSARKVDSFMSPLAQILPQLIVSVCGHVASPWPANAFTFSRVAGLSQNTRGGDCGPICIKFIEFHIHGMQDALSKLTPTQVNNLRMRYAIDMYEKYVAKL